MIALIWAMDENWLIGSGNILPWHIREDLDYFKEMTKDKTVLMGHMTYLSLKGYYKSSPLPFKKIYVANIEKYSYNDAIIVNDVIKFLKETKEEIFVVGGKVIYELSLPYADILYITHVLGSHKGDVYFPKFPLSKDFKISDYRTSEKLIFAKYKRKWFNVYSNICIYVVVICIINGF